MAGQGFWQPLADTGGGTTTTASSVAGMGTVALDPVAPNTVVLWQTQAVYDVESDRTYITWLGEGRDAYVAAFSHATGTLSDPVLVGTYPLADSDTHGSPALAIDHDGHIHIVWGAHGDVANAVEHRHSKSDNPRDISAWTTQVLTGGGTYPRLVVADNGDLLLFDRAGNDNGTTFPSKQFMSVRRSTDQWTWSGHAGIISSVGHPDGGSNMYPHSATAVDGVVHLSWTVLAGGTGSTTNEREHLYHAVYDQATGDLSSMDGTALGSQITWAEHADCLAYSTVPLWGSAHLARSADDVSIVFKAGTDPTPGFGDTDATGTYTWHVTTWTGTAWTTTDLGVDVTWNFAQAILVPWGDGMAALLTTTDGDLVVWTSPDGIDFYDAGTLLESSTGEGWTRVSSVLGGRLLALAQESHEDWATTSATSADLLPIYGISALPAPSPHGNEHHTEAFGTGTGNGGGATTGLAETIFAPAYTVTDGTTLDLDITFVWGIDGFGDPYYNSAGVTAGDEAVLVHDHATGDFSLRPVEV